MTEKERMQAGELYCAGDKALAADRVRARQLIRRYNDSPDDDPPGRNAILSKLLGSMGSSLYIEPPFRCDYGYNIHIGDSFYANYDCIILDVCPVKIGSSVMFGPRISLFTATHPLDAAVRTRPPYLELGAPITIGDRVWLGGGTCVMPGVTIGENSIIGSGSVVTRDIPPNVIAAGNPCHVLREITTGDQSYWENEAAKYRL